MENRIHQSLDGSVVIIVADFGVLAERSLSHLVYKAGNYVAEFEWGPSGFAAEVAGWLGVSFDEEYDFGGGLLRLATAWNGPTAQQLAGWEGHRYDLKTTIFSTRRQDLVDIVSRVAIMETPEGLAVKQSGGDIEFPVPGFPPSVTQFIQGVGFAEIFPMYREVVDRLPNWPGAPTAGGGELFVEKGVHSHDDPEDRMEASESTTLLLVTSSAVSRFYIDDNRSISDVANVVDGLSIEWRSPELISSTKQKRFRSDVDYA